MPSTALLLPVAAYLLGSISCAVLASRLFGLPDPRCSGSGNPGATNVWRSGHHLAAALTLGGDLLKGMLPVLVGQLLALPLWVLMLSALATVSGHLWPIYFRFQGGKGVATTLGSCLALEPLLGLCQLGIWSLVAGYGRTASVAALGMALASVPLALWLMPPISPLIALFALLLLWRHRGNIHQLSQGREPPLKFRN